jgi:hypothetical protein
LPLPITITITSPAKGQVIRAGQDFQVQWQSSGNLDKVKLQFSSNNGTNWTVLDTNVPNTGSYNWASVPQIDSNNCLIRVGADSGPNGTSDNFTIFKCAAWLKADFNGDCYVNALDFAEFARQWLICGNPTDPDWCTR